MPGWVFAQPPGVLSLEEVQRIRTERLEREALTALEYRMRPSQRFLFDYGGWYRFTYLTYDDLNNSLTRTLQRVLRLQDLRLWAVLNLDNVQTFYVRQRTLYYDWNESYRGRNDELNFDLDQAFYSVQIDRALRRYLDVNLPLRLRFTGGKFFSEIGTGLVYSRVALGMELKGQSRFVNFTLFSFWTPPGEVSFQSTVSNFTEGVLGSLFL